MIFRKPAVLATLSLVGVLALSVALSHKPILVSADTAAPVTTNPNSVSVSTQDLSSLVSAISSLTTYLSTKPASSLTLPSPDSAQYQSLKRAIESDLIPTLSHSSDGAASAAGVAISSLASGGTLTTPILTSPTVTGGLTASGNLTVNGVGNNYFAGKLGIGISAPDALLSINSNWVPTGRWTSMPSSVGAVFELSKNDSTAAMIQAVATGNTSPRGLVVLSQSSASNAGDPGYLVSITGSAEHSGSATASGLVGVRGQADTATSGSVGNVTAMIGVQGVVEPFRGGITVTTASSFQTGAFAGAGTISTYYGYQSQNPDSSITITNAAGLQSDNLTTGTNNTNLLLGTANVPTGNYSIYNSSSYKNYFAGNLGLGTSTANFNLTVAPTSGSALIDLKTVSGTNIIPGILFDNGNGSLALMGFNCSNGSSCNFSGTGAGTINALQLGTAGALPLQLFTNNNARLVIDSSGNVGIASTSPWRTLSVTGTVGFDGLTSSTGTGSLCLTASKEVVYNAADTCLPSLRATKHDINSLTLSGLGLVNKLDPVQFFYNFDATHSRYGFIAEDASAVDSHFGSYNEKGGLTGIDDRALIAVAIKAIQELNTKVNNLTATTSTSTVPITDSSSFAENLSYVGGQIVNNVINFSELVVSNLTAKHATINELVLNDKDTGQPYCVTVRSGALSLVPGTCGAVATSLSTTSVTATSSTPSSATTTSVSSTDTSTTTATTVSTTTPATNTTTSTTTPAN